MYHKACFRGQALLVLAQQRSLFSVPAPCVGYLPLATASCGLESLSFLTSFPFPDPSHMCTGCHFLSLSMAGVCGRGKFTCTIQVPVPFLAFSLSFCDTVREASKSTFMNLCRETFPQPF